MALVGLICAHAHLWTDQRGQGEERLDWTGLGLMPLLEPEVEFQGQRAREGHFSKENLGTTNRKTELALQ